MGANAPCSKPPGTVTPSSMTPYAMTAHSRCRGARLGALVFQAHYRAALPRPQKKWVRRAGRTGFRRRYPGRLSPQASGEVCPVRSGSIEARLFVVALNRIQRSRRRAALFAPPLRQMQTADAEDAALTRVDAPARLEALSPREREPLVAKFYVGLTQDVPRDRASGRRAARCHQRSAAQPHDSAPQEATDERVRTIRRPHPPARDRP